MGVDFGTSKHMNLATPLAAAEFQPFAPAPCSCLFCCCGDAVRERMYIHAHDNRLQYNAPCAPLLCCTKEICVMDDARILYFDKPPFRSGPCGPPCCCLAFTCCGPPVIYSKTPKCLCVDCSPYFGETLNVAPCNCFRLRTCLCFGAPCYDCIGMPYFSGLKNAREFSRVLQDVYDNNFRTGIGLDINQKELATFEHMANEGKHLFYHGTAFLWS